MRPRLLLAALSFLAAGCATVVNGRFHTVSVDSFPSGAKIGVHCGDVPQDAGVTPARVTVERAAEQCLITLSRDGYEPRVVVLSHQVSRATVLNGVWGVPTAILGGIVGIFLDDLLGTDGSITSDAAAAGFNLGAGGATAVDTRGGGYKWVPGRLFVTLVRTEIAARPRDAGQ